MDLGDVEWGDVCSDDDGILVVEGMVGDARVVVKRYADARGCREIVAYDLLGRLGVPTLTVLGAGRDWLILDALDGFERRLAEPDDLGDPAVGRAVARWYDALHAAGRRLSASELDALGAESDIVDAAALRRVAATWPELASGVSWALTRLDGWLDDLAALPRTLNHNDFSFTNLALAWDGSAVVFDLDRLTAGYRYADVRNVTWSMSPEAAEAFRDEYGRCLRARGVAMDASEASVDEPLSHLAALATVASARGEGLPAWAAASYAWLAGH